MYIHIPLTTPVSNARSNAGSYVQVRPDTPKPPRLLGEHLRRRTLIADGIGQVLRVRADAAEAT